MIATLLPSVVGRQFLNLYEEQGSLNGKVNEDTRDAQAP